MGADLRKARVKNLRVQMPWLQCEVAEYESRRPEMGIENGICAARKCAEMASPYRQRTDNLAAIMAATEEADA